MVLTGHVALDEWFSLLQDVLSEDEKNMIRVHIMQDKAHPRRNIGKPTDADVHDFIAMAARLIAAQRKADKKITDQAAEEAKIKDELEANPPDPSKVKKPRTKKRAKRPGDDAPSKKARDYLIEAAQELTRRRIANGEKLNYDFAWKMSFMELNAGVFNPLHWKEATQLSEDHFQAVPTTGPDPKARTYAYPDASNKRTLATYGDGTLSTAPPRYSGGTEGGFFKDSLLVWKRLTFELLHPFHYTAVEPLFIQIDGTVVCFADKRGSAPMLSYIAKTWNVKDDSPLLETTLPPTVKSWSFYFRFKLPMTAPPYYATHEVKRGVRTMRQRRHEETDGMLAKSVVLVAPRPMYGRGFNNNTRITTQFNPTVKIWQIDLPERADIPSHICWGGTYVADLRAHPDFEALVCAQGSGLKFQAHEASAEEVMRMLDAAIFYDHPYGYLGGGGNRDEFTASPFFSLLPDPAPVQGINGMEVALPVWQVDWPPALIRYPGPYGDGPILVTGVYTRETRSWALHPGIHTAAALGLDPAEYPPGLSAYPYA